jgi:tRNA (adenine-N(1)-)-methyltransferase non-catalytic subunit
MSPSPPSPVIPKEAWAGCNVILDINDGDRVIFDRLTRRASVPSPDSRPQPFCPPN